MAMLRQTVLDSLEPRRAAEFWRQFLGWAYRPGDEPPPAGQADPNGEDWLVLRTRTAASGWRSSGSTSGPAELAAAGGAAAAAPGPTVPDIAALDAEHERVLGLGATLLDDSPATRPAGAAAGLRRPGRAPVLHLRRLDRGAGAGWRGRTGEWTTEPSGTAGAPSRRRLGTMTFGAETDEPGAHEQLDRFVEAGGKLVDTADVYSPAGRSRSSADGSPAAGRRDRSGRAGDQGPLPDRRLPNGAACRPVI